MQCTAQEQSYQVHLEIFEGPLDLLLHLIRQQEIDIYDIPISRITDQYLEYLQIMEDLNISIAGEFLVVAATLIYIKSKMLLPADPLQDDESEEDPRIELVEQLLEHERFKNAAGMLHDRQIVEDSVWCRGVNEFEEEEKEAVSATVFDLVRAFHTVLERFKEQIVLEVAHETVSISEKLAELRRLLQVHKEFFFSLFLKQEVSRLNLVVTFIALLELARLRELQLGQTKLFDDIRIVAC